MKRWLKIGILLWLFGISLPVVRAQSVSLLCPKSVKPGNKFTCTINASHDSEYGGIDAVLSYSEGLTYNSFSKNYSNGEIYNNKLSVYDVDLKKGSSKVGTITFTLNKNAKESQTISLSNIVMYDADSLGMNIGNVSSTVKIDTSSNKSSGASSGKGGNASSESGTGTVKNSSKIKSLVINNGNIEFNKDVTEYEITVGNNVTKLDIEIALETSSSKYSIKGNDNFQVGENLVEITVTPKSGMASVYKIKVRRLAQSNNSLLDSLKIADYEVDFKSNKFKYNIYIDNKTDKLEMEALAVDEKSVVVIGGNDNLKTGSIISIVVQAEDGSTSMYVLKIIEKVSLIYVGIGGTLLLMGIITLVIILIRRKKKNNQIFMDLKP